MDVTKLSLREKIGQMFMCGLHGTEPSKDIMDLINEYHLGGVIYFRRNIKDVQQVSRLSLELQSAAMQHKGIPLFISIDQEGGMVARIDRGITLMPGNMALGAAGDVEGVYAASEIAGRELRLMGINMNFAPCLDINNNPQNPVIGVRSFGETPELVSQMGAASLQGYQASNVAATAKHFPGHGDTETDSHLDLPLIPHDMKRLQQVELVPFVRAIREGVDAIMSAHIVFPAIEPEVIPATLSHKVITGLLRKQLAYEGVVISDCLEMKAISEGVGIEEGTVMAVEAGIDLVLISHLKDRQLKGIEALIRAVESGRISEERIDQSVRRILALKEKRQMHEIQPQFSEISSKFGTEASWEIARKLSEKSITLIKDLKQLPLNVQEKIYVIWPEVRKGTEVDEIIDQEDSLGVILANYMKDVEEDRIGIDPTPEEKLKVLQKSSAFQQIIFVSYNAYLSKGQQSLIRDLSIRKNLRLVVAAARNPFDLVVFPDVKTYIACYENRPLAMRSLAKVLIGENKAEGILPISLI
jgi:beta-N-acetylhexosaminidase